MTGTGYLTLAALILLLLPIVVLPWEGRRVPGWLYATIAAAGLGFTLLFDGPAATAWAAATGMATLLAVAGIATGIRQFLDLHVFTSGHIRLLSAGAIWLGPSGALAMGILEFMALVGLAIVRTRSPVRRRPDFSAIAACAILCVGLAQALPIEKTTTARAARTYR